MDGDLGLLVVILACFVILATALWSFLATTDRLIKALQEANAQHAADLARLQLLHNARRDAQGE